MMVLCKVSIVDTIKYQNKDANRFAVLTVLWSYYSNPTLFERTFSNCSNDKYQIEIQIYVNNWQ